LIAKGVEDTKKIVNYLDPLANTYCEALLQLLRGYNPDVQAAPALLPKRSLEEYMDQMEKAEQEDDKTRVYEDAMRTQQKAAIDNKYDGKIPSHQLQMGLQITLIPLSTRGLGEVKAIHRKEDQGANPISRKKIRDKITNALEPKICTGNICQIHTSVNANSLQCCH
jgi:hypothetical protein